MFKFLYYKRYYNKKGKHKVWEVFEICVTNTKICYINKEETNNSRQNWAKNVNRKFTEQETQMANKHKKKWLVSLKIIENIDLNILKWYAILQRADWQEWKIVAIQSWQRCGKNKNVHTL